MRDEQVMGHGILDTDVPYPTTLLRVTALNLTPRAGHVPQYTTDHSGALTMSEKDTAPSVQKLFR